MMEWWSDGMLEWWNGGILEYWSTGCGVVDKWCNEMVYGRDRECNSDCSRFISDQEESSVDKRTIYESVFFANRYFDDRNDQTKPHYSITPIFQYSITPLLHNSIL